jgi:VanZ family protein
VGKPSTVLDYCTTPNPVAKNATIQNYQTSFRAAMSDPSDQPAANSDRGQTSILKRVVTPAAATYWLALYVGTHIPNPDMLIGANVSDKILHFSAYFGLYLVLAVRMRILNEAWPTKRQTIILAAMTSLYSAFDEITQGIPIINRHPDIMDAVADCGGVVAAILVVGIADWSEKRIRAASPVEDSTDS